MNIAEFQRNVYPALSKMIFEEYKRYPPQYPRVFNVKPTNRWYEEHQTEAGYGLFTETGDQENYAQDDMKPGYYTKFQLAKYTKYFRVSEDLLEFDRYITAGNRATSLGNKGRSTREVLAAQVYNNSFVTNQADGVPLFSASHPGYPGSGQLFSNVLATQATLSYTSFQSAITAIKTITDERGVLIQLMPRKLVVHPTYELVAREILKSTDRPDTASRASNEMKNIAPGMELVVYPFLNSTTMWFILCDVFHVYAYEHGGLRTRTAEDPFNADKMVFGSFYLSTGTSHYLGAYAGSA